MRGIGTKTSEKEVYQLTKVREKRSNDFQNLCCIKNKDEIVMRMKKCWEEYFEKLLNEEADV